MIKFLCDLCGCRAKYRVSSEESTNVVFIDDRFMNINEHHICERCANTLGINRKDKSDGPDKPGKENSGDAETSPELKDNTLS